ncbi:MAG: hypothetical protein NZM25_07145 [Leptospiraceae bacterium]|nr:hypothetical protein [Leptospiraceae bacterium]MDW8307094.1 hypothetical protein [Leptospiraceae bacterium]
MQGRLVLLVLSMTWGSTHAIRYPVTPSEPSIPQEESKKRKEGQVSLLKVKVKLGSGDELFGEISLPSSITFSHYKNGLLFRKTLRPEEIKKIRILSYRESRASASLFEYEPERTQILTKDLQEFYISGIFTFLRKIEIETVDGKTTLFTIFADSWDEKSGWREVASRDRHYHQKHPHPKAVYEIEIEGEVARAEEKAGSP